MKSLLARCGLALLWLGHECQERLPRALRAAWRAWCVLGGLYLLGYFVGVWWMRRLP
jgi:hypothetical protein